MVDTDLYEICMDCGTQFEVTYGKTVNRPANTDHWYRKDHECPVCGGDLIAIINAGFDNKFKLKSEIDYAISRKEKLYTLLKEISEHNNQQYKIMKGEVAAEKKKNCPESGKCDGGCQE